MMPRSFVSKVEKAKDTMFLEGMQIVIPVASLEGCKRP